MKETAVVICNYNKENYVVNCIKSVLESTYSNYDIYVVDNASIDNSVEAIQKNFSDKVTLILNEENKGGSGGFNSGMKHVLNKNYKYIYLLDNDVVIDKDGLMSLVDFLDKNQEVGAVGSQIYFMDSPNIIQEFGSFIDFEIFNMRIKNRGNVNKEINEEFIECDYLPACSMLLRSAALDKVGIFNENYFVYWDDIDFGYRLKNTGYKIISTSLSKVWHKGGGNVRSNTFGTYYFWRNRVEFFLKYCDNLDVNKFVQKLFDDLIKSIYSCNYIGKLSTAKTILMAVDDALNGIKGKAQDNRIFEVESIDLNNKFSNILGKIDKIMIDNNNNFQSTIKVVNRILELNKDVEITVINNNNNNCYKEYFKGNILFIENENDMENYGLKIKLCPHILELEEIENGYIYIDEYFNIIETEKDKEYINNYKMFYEMNKSIFIPFLLNKILINKNGGKEKGV